MRDDAISTAPAGSHEDAPIAPWPHTAAVLIVLLLTTVLSHMRVSAVSEQMPKTFRYLSSGLLEWTFLGSVIAGLYHRRAFLRRALLNPHRSWLSSLSLGVPVYIAGLGAIVVVGSAVAATPLRAHSNPSAVLGMTPHTPWEFLLWFGVSLTAGVCEELVFRGYLLQQFTAWTRSPLLAIAVTSLLFGSVHLYEGLAAILPLAALALVYGFIVRRSNGDLRAVIVAHTLQDFLVALMMLSRPFVEHHLSHR
jgi:membrane protease YdiL (CAAX protease family)